MLWNKSKQMGSMAKVAWHDEEGGGRREEGQQPRNTLVTSGMTVPGRCVATRPVSWLTLRHFWETNLGFWHVSPRDYALSNVFLFPIRIDKLARLRSQCSFPS